MRKLLNKPLQSKRYLILLISAVSILLITGAYFYFSYEADSIRNEKYTNLKAICMLKISQIKKWEKERYSDAKVFSDGPFLSWNLERLIASQNLLVKAVIIQKIGLIQKESGYLNIIVTNSSGIPLISAQPLNGGVDSLTSAFILKSISTRKILNTGLYRSRESNKIYIDFIAPIYKDGKPAFAIILRVDPDRYLYPLIREWPTASKTSETLIVRREGNYVLYLNNIRFRKNTALRYKLPLTRTESPAVKAALGYRGILDGINYRRSKVLAYITSVPGTRWIMISRVDDKEIFSSLLFREFVIISGTMLLIILFGFGLFWYYHFRQSNIYRELFEKEKDLREYHEEFKTILYSIGDGVISTDSDFKIKQMNHIAEELTGWAESDSVGKPIDAIFNIINEDRNEGIENPVYRALKEGRIVEPANHTILISKNGTEIPVADSAAPIKNEIGEIKGVILIFRDKSSDYFREKVIRQSEARLNRAELASKSGNWELHMDSRTMVASQGAAKIYGLDKEMFDFEIVKKIPLPEYRPLLDEALRNLIEKNEPYEIDFKIRTADSGEIKFIHSIAEYDKKDQILFGVIQDITARKLAELALRETEEKWESLFEFSPNAIAVYKAADDGKDFIFTDFNFAASKTDNIDRDKVIGRRLTKVFPGVEKTGIIETLNKVWRSGESERLEIKYYSNGRTEVWRDNIIYKLKTGEIVAIYSDITDRINAEISLRNSEEKFRNIVQTANEGIMISDPENRITFANRALGEILGCPPDEIIGKNIKDFIFDSEYIDLEKKMVRRSSGKHDLFERRYKRSDGTEVIGLVSAVSLSDENNKFTGSLAMITDITEMKKAERELRETEERFKTVYNASPVAISITEIKSGKVIEVNEAFERIFGYRKEEVFGKSTLEIGVWKNRVERNKILEILQKNKIFDNVEIEFKTKKGTFITCLTAGRTIKINDSDYFLALVNDITSKKKAEKELRESEERFRTLFEDNRAPMFLIDPYDGRIVDVNKATVELYGWKREELLNMSIDRIDTMPEDKLKKILENAFINKQSHFETKHRLADGSIRDVEITSSSIIMNGMIFRHSIVHDITSRKQAEEQVQLLAHAVETTEEGITIMDLNNNILFVNDAFARIFGYTAKEVTGRNMKSLHSNHEVNPEYEDIYTDSMKKGWTGEFVSRRKDGSEFNIFLSTSPVKDDDGVTYAIVGIIMDITERIKKEAELENYRHNLEEQVKHRTVQLDNANTQLREQLCKEKELEIILKKSLENEKELNELKTRFISTASHEFRTPLTAVFSSAELIQRYGRKWSGEKLKEHVDRIKNSVDYITKLLDEVLTISRVESGKIDYSPEKINLQEFCSELIDEVRPLSDNNHLLALDYQPEELYFYLDPKLLRFIIINLLSNAVKYSPHGGEVELTVENSASNLILKISDKGIGIPETDKSHLFEPFHRCENAGEIPGTGLGLSIVKQSVNLHGGSISVKSVLGTGSVFTVKIKLDSNGNKKIIKENSNYLSS